MFEPGQFYTVTMRGADVMGDIQIFTYRAKKVELPLIMFECPDGSEKIINTTSSAFVSAVPRRTAA
jgi:hypothetical protein